MITKCPKCNADNPDTQSFCGDCGTQLTPSTEIPTVTKTLETPVQQLTKATVFANRYEIIEKLGKGGMGEVYRVKDVKLDEEMALKFMRPEIASDEKTINRFKNELKLARKIAHRNVCKMYDLLEEEDTPFITLEYVEGENLKSLIKKKEILEEKEIIAIAKQVCEGLSEAHRLGVVHRDLKPQNIMIDKDGNVKVMDFGIARSVKASGVTQTGVMIGTPDYISPEQAEGEEADQRSDIYSLGVILYEMVTGQVPFRGDTALSVALKHRAQLPQDPRKLNTDITENLSRLILICMEKAKDRRYQTAEALLGDLQNIEEGLPLGTKIKPSRATFTQTLIQKKFLVSAFILIALALVIILSIFLIDKLSIKESDLPTYRQLTFTGNAHSPTISPDGNFLAYFKLEPSGEIKVMVHDLISGQAIEVFKSKGYGLTKWISDGSELSISRVTQSVKPQIFIVPRLGGTPRQLEIWPIYDWSPDGSQIAETYVNYKWIRLTDKSTGESKSIPLKGSFTWLHSITWSPLGNLILFRTTDERQQNAIWTVTVDGGQQNKVVEETTRIYSARWSPRGDAIYYLRRQGQIKELMKIPVNLDSGKPSKPASLVISGLQVGTTFHITSDGKSMVHTRELFYGNLWLAQIEGSGKNQRVKTKKLTTGTLLHGDPNISPDGKLIAFFRGDGSKSNIFIMPVEGGPPQQITFLNSYNRSPVWSPDGKEIAFGSNEGGAPRVWKVSTKGGKLRQFSESILSNSYSIAWSPGAHILYQRPGNRNFHILEPETGKEIPLVKDDSVGYIVYAEYSPDGRKVALFWNRFRPQPSRGIWVIFIEDFSLNFIKEGEEIPIGWSPDGKWIYARSLDSTRYIKIELLSERVKTLPTISFTIEGKSYTKLLDGGPSIFLDNKTNSDVWIIDNFDPEVK